MNTKIKYSPDHIPFVGLKEDRKLYLEPDENGVYMSEMWNLDICIASFIIPRLELFRETVNEYPVSIADNTKDFDKNLEIWKEILQKMIVAFKIVEKGEYGEEFDEKNVKEGLKLFAKHMTGLWNQ